MTPTKSNPSPEDVWKLWHARRESRASLLARAEKAEQERDQALEKARDRECARVMETDRADGISETLREARKHIDELEEKYTAARISLHLAEQSYEREQRVVVEISELKAAQRPRPMDEAPKGASEFLGHHETLGWFNIRRLYKKPWFYDWRDTPWPEDKFVSWLPLPDHDDKIS